MTRARDGMMRFRKQRGPGCGIGHREMLTICKAVFLGILGYPCQVRRQRWSLGGCGEFSGKFYWRVRDASGRSQCATGDKAVRMVMALDKLQEEWKRGKGAYTQSLFAVVREPCRPQHYEEQEPVVFGGNRLTESNDRLRIELGEEWQQDLGYRDYIRNRKNRTAMSHYLEATERRVLAAAWIQYAFDRERRG
ncbi:hypothetical protein RUM43_009410 [Polyplax serrata]|uniref:Uncharacterized protein n=1 Tax=Polyplax serrata TaxID=468196 RepID=A0AAN8PIF2_POLSC